MRVIVAEKPSMGRAIAAALGIVVSGRNFIQHGNTIVTWCIGHLVEAMNPESYDPQLKSWRLDNLPIFPAEFKVHSDRADKRTIQPCGKSHHQG